LPWRELDEGRRGRGRRREEKGGEGRREEGGREEGMVVVARHRTSTEVWHGGGSLGG
jgi:hypothetical protein